MRIVWKLYENYNPHFQYQESNQLHVELALKPCVWGMGDSSLKCLLKQYYKKGLFIESNEIWRIHEQQEDETTSVINKHSTNGGNKLNITFNQLIL